MLAELSSFAFKQIASSPFDRVKIILQTQREKQRNLEEEEEKVPKAENVKILPFEGVFACLRDLVQREGPLSLWKGVPYAFFEKGSSILANYAFGSVLPLVASSLPPSFFSSFAGMLGWRFFESLLITSVTYPFQVLFLFFLFSMNLCNLFNFFS